MITKLLNFLVLLALPISAFADIANGSTILAADKAYTTGNLSKLATLYQHNNKVRIVSYLYAKGILTKNIATPTENFIKIKHDDYMRIDLIHQLLIYYYQNNDYTSYIRTFNLLPQLRANNNERCGYDLANTHLHKDTTPLMNSSWLISNSLPPWCADLMTINYVYRQISSNERDFMLVNLILNKHTDIFNSIASGIGISPINFYQYQNKNISKNSPNYKFITAYKISAVAKKSPDLALSILDNSSLSSEIKSIIYGYLGMQFALNQNFKQAIKMYDYANLQYLSDDEFEWRVRSYLGLQKWDMVTTSIKDMPATLQKKSVWLYWNGKALAQLDQDSTAILSYKQVANDYSYYSMLAKNEAHEIVPFIVTKAVTAKNALHSIYLNNANDAISLYLFAQKNHSKNLANIASTEWLYAAKYATDKELIKMTNLARTSGSFDLSIAAANQMSIHDMHLSYPILFLNSYTIHSRQAGIDASYALAVTRQESRFNYKVIAFDGGVGLMQIMPGTASYIAKKSNSVNCYRSSYDCNIKFGTWYLGNLYHKFNSNYIYATAAYNGGPNRARRWEDNLSNLDILIQMELIPINITRGYVQKVLSNKAVYDSELNSNNSVNLLQYIKSLPLKHYLQEPDDDKTDAEKM